MIVRQYPIFIFQYLNMFKRLLVACFIVASFAVPVVALAENYGLTESGVKSGYIANAQSESFSLGQFIASTVKVALTFVAILLFGLILYSGIRWMTAQGNEEAVAQAKDTLQTALIGFVIIAAAYGVTTFIFNLVNK